MEKIYKQFEEGFKKHITGEEWVHDYGSKHWAHLVATSILKEEKLARDDVYGEHLLVERFYLNEPQQHYSARMYTSHNVFQVKDAYEDQYINNSRPGEILKRAYETLKFLYGKEISNPKFIWKITEEFIDVYMYSSHNPDVSVDILIRES
ncbi:MULTISPECIES: hypothetical protein [Bacillus]|uniref:hypothetical protein n=1 Tax=Bacillus TaxID=1386 RepID=UPI0009954E87|nr:MULTISPECIES: hypothetical protein [Bacillus cereus group]OOZ85016.1 hypothetical protein BHL25_19320 [Bacillus cereus]WIG25014.1 hypothetical protein QPL81_01500 [Bacillus toyonensis]